MKQFQNKFFYLLALLLLVSVGVGCDADDDDDDDTDGDDDTGDDDDDTDGDDDTGDDDTGDDDDDTGDEPLFEITFFVVSDTHCDHEPDTGHYASARAINSLTETGIWPLTIEGEETGFAGGTIESPLGVVFTGDITGSGNVSALSNELDTFRQFYEPGYSADSIAYPSYVGLGNHDLDRDDLFADAYRQKMWEYVEERHKSQTAPTPAMNFDAASRNYSWDWEGVHLIQTHKCATDTTSGQTSALAWLSEDLSENAADGRPVVLFQHYGFDAFGMQERWWTDADREALDAVLDGYNIAAIIVGHTHYAMNYHWEDRRVFHVNNIKAEIGEGNNDGNGSFMVVRMTDTRLDMMTCRWLSEHGDVEFIDPYLSMELD